MVVLITGVTSHEVTILSNYLRDQHGFSALVGHDEPDCLSVGIRRSSSGSWHLNTVPVKESMMQESFKQSAKIVKGYSEGCQFVVGIRRGSR